MDTLSTKTRALLLPKGPFRTVFSTESDSVLFYYSVVNLLRIVIHYSKYSKSVQNVVIHYIFSSESLRVVNSLQIVNSLRVLFLVCRGPLGQTPENDENDENHAHKDPVCQKPCFCTPESFLEV